MNAGGIEHQVKAAQRMVSGHRALHGVAVALGMEAEQEHQEASISEYEAEIEYLLEQLADAVGFEGNPLHGFEQNLDGECATCGYNRTHPVHTLRVHG
jgi:hypothetical protein